MGERKRRAEAKGEPPTVVVFGRDETKGGWLLPPGDADGLYIEIGTPPNLDAATGRECAEWLMRAAPQKPGAVIAVTVGGFDDDGREVYDIPEAREALRAFALRMAELDTEGRIAARMDRSTRVVLAVCAGWLARAAVNPEPWSLDERVARLRADHERARAAQALQDAQDAAWAARWAAREPKN